MYFNKEKIETFNERIIFWKKEIEKASSDFGSLFDKISDEDQPLNLDIKIFDELLIKKDPESLRKVRVVVLGYIAFIDSILLIHKREIIKTPLRHIKERLLRVIDQMQDFY